MITLYYSKKTAGVTQLEERLIEMSLGYKIKEKGKISTVELRDGDQRYKGFVAIHKHLDEVQGELKKWWYCNC